MRSWRIYYADGSTYDDSDGSWMDAPPRGIAGIPHPDPVSGRVIEHDHLYFMPAEFEYPQGCDLLGALDHLIQVGEVGLDVVPAELPAEVFFRCGIKWGRTMPSRAWREMWQRMDADPDFPARSGFHRKERRP